MKRLRYRAIIIATMMFVMNVMTCGVSAEETSEEERIAQIFEDYGYEVSDEAELYAIEVEEINGQGTAVEYVMQEEVGNEIEVTYVCELIDPEMADVLSTGTSSSSHQENYTSSTLVSISGTASFKIYTNTSKTPTRLIQPQSVSFSYLKKKDTASVTYAAARYVCHGRLRNTSTWSIVNSDYRYTILCGRNNPIPSNYYSSSTPISSARGIDISDAGFEQLITFELTINGSSYSYPGIGFKYA